MLKALLKKQMLEFAAIWFKNHKTGKMRSGKSLVLFIILFVFVFASMAAAFVGMSMLFADSFLPLGLDWLYFAMMGMIAIMLGVFGDVFNSFSTLYLAKDNELLLSLPVKPSYILTARMVSVYIMGFIYEAVVFLPAVIVYWIKKQLTFQLVLFPLLLLFGVGLVVLVLTCILGYFVAQIAARIKGKAFITALSSVLILLIYYFCYFKLNGFLQLIAANPGAIGDKIKAVYPLYLFGLAGAGDVKSLLIVLVGMAALCAVLFMVLSKTFIGIATKNRGMKKTEYTQKTMKSANVSSALLKREFKRFTSSAVYMMNSGLGLIILLGIAVIAVIKADYLHEMLGMLSVAFPEMLSLYGPVVVLVVCLIISMNQFTAPSVSLEGKYLWVLRSLPVNAADVLRAKEKMHVILNVVPSVVCYITLCVVVKTGLLAAVCGMPFVIAFILFTAELGLLADLKNPVLVWTNENVPVKQNTAVLFAMLGCFGVNVVFAAACWFGSNVMPAYIVCLIAAAVLFAAALLMRRSVYTKGVQIFERL